MLPRQPFLGLSCHRGDDTRWYASRGKNLSQHTFQVFVPEMYQWERGLMVLFPKINRPLVQSINIAMEFYTQSLSTNNFMMIKIHSIRTGINYSASKCTLYQSDPTDLILRKGTSFEAMTGRTAPSLDGLTSWGSLRFSSAVRLMTGDLCTAHRIISLPSLSLATDVTDATLWESVLWLGTRSGAGGTATLVLNFFGRSLHGSLYNRVSCTLDWVK